MIFRYFEYILYRTDLTTEYKMYLLVIISKLFEITPMINYDLSSLKQIFLYPELCKQTVFLHLKNIPFGDFEMKNWSLHCSWNTKT